MPFPPWSPAPTTAASAAGPAIVVGGLVKRYGRTLAVDHLDLEVGQGETFALLGPNGAGKTTTIECCEGYLRPDEGTVRVLGLDPAADGAALRRRMGLMLQEGGVYPTARPHEVLRLFAAFHPDPLDPDELLVRVGLRERTRTRFRDLSGGERQRLSLALAIVGRPQVVFLDEPTAGLDPWARRSAWELLRELRAGGVTVVLTTHLLDEAEVLADRIAIIDRGRLVALGTPDELVHGDPLPELRFTAASGLDVAGLGRRLGADVVEWREGRYVARTTATPRTVAALATWLDERDVTIGSLHAGREGLEEVFLRLTASEEEEG